MGELKTMNENELDRFFPRDAHLTAVTQKLGVVVSGSLSRGLFTFRLLSKGTGGIYNKCIR